MRSLLIALVLLFSAGSALADDVPLNLLAADYASYAMGQDPIAAGRAGDKKALAKMPDVSPGADVLRKSFLEEFRERLAAIDPAGLSPEARQKRDTPRPHPDGSAEEPGRRRSSPALRPGTAASTCRSSSSPRPRAWTPRPTSWPGFPG